MPDELIQRGVPAQDAPLPRSNYTAALLGRAAAEQRISAEKLDEIRSALHQAAAARAAAYTKGKSTTVTRKQAEAFYASVFCQLDTVLLELHSDAKAEEALRSGSLPELLDAGMLMTLQRYETAKDSFRKAYKLTAPVQTSFFHALLKDFEQFCTKYDARFRAADTKVSYSYPLLSEEVITEPGVLGVYRYYTALQLEGELLQLFRKEDIRALMQRYAEKFLTTPDMIAENIAALVLRHWLVCALCGESGCELTVTQDMLQNLQAEYAALAPEQLSAAMCSVLPQLSTDNPQLQTYLAEAVPALALTMHQRMQKDRLAGWMAPILSEAS